MGGPEFNPQYCKKSKYRERTEALKFTVQVTSFQKFQFTFEFLLLTTNIINCFPWSDRLTVSIFKKLSAKYPILNNQFVRWPFEKKWCSMKKAASQVFPFAVNHCTLGCHRSVSLAFFISSEYLRQRLNKTSNFYCSIKDILKWSWPYFSCTGMVVKIRINMAIWCHCPDSL